MLLAEKFFYIAYFREGSEGGIRTEWDKKALLHEDKGLQFPDLKVVSSGMYVRPTEETFHGGTFGYGTSRSTSRFLMPKRVADLPIRIYEHGVPYRINTPDFILQVL